MKKQKTEKRCKSTHTHTHTDSYSNRKGITLVALVITIIVLLILAGVAIRAIVGDNGVLNQSTKASEKTKYKQAKEIAEMQTEYIESGVNAGKADLTTTQQKIQDLIDTKENAEIEKVSDIKKEIDDEGNEKEYIEVTLTNKEKFNIYGVSKSSYSFTIGELFGLDLHDSTDCAYGVMISDFEELIGGTIEELWEQGFVGDMGEGNPYEYGIIDISTNSSDVIGPSELFNNMGNMANINNKYMLELCVDKSRDEIEIWLIKIIDNKPFNYENDTHDLDEIAAINSFAENYKDTVITIKSKDDVEKVMATMQGGE